MDNKSMNHQDMLSVTDEQLLTRFFAEARTPVSDDGFTVCVLEQIAALRAAQAPANATSLSQLTRWNFWLNTIAALSGILLFIQVGVLGQAWKWLCAIAHRIIVGLLSFDFDNLLVQVMLFLHRLPDMLPSSVQLYTIGLTVLVLLVLGAQRLVQIEGKIYHDIEGFGR